MYETEMTFIILTYGYNRGCFPFTGTTTKSVSVQIEFIDSNGTVLPALTAMFVNAEERPPGTLNKSKLLTRVNNEIAAYPAATDNVELCDDQPDQASQTLPVPDGSSGAITRSHALSFDQGVYLQIRHDVTGKPGDSLQPSRQ